MAEITECTAADEAEFWQDTPQDVTERPVSRWDGGSVREVRRTCEGG